MSTDKEEVCKPTKIMNNSYVIKLIIKATQGSPQPNYKINESNQDRSMH